MVLIVIVAVASIIGGVIIGNEIRRITQKNLCPYCSCRECCSIGYKISAKCTEDEQHPFMCMK